MSTWVCERVGGNQDIAPGHTGYSGDARLDVMRIRISSVQECSQVCLCLSTLENWELEFLSENSQSVEGKGREGT